MNFHKNSSIIIFGVAESESGVKIEKFKMADLKNGDRRGGWGVSSRVLFSRYNYHKHR